MSRTRYRIYDNAYPHFATCTVIDWLPVFTRQETVQILLESWRFLQQHQRLTLYSYVVLENHCHFIASGKNLAKEIGHFKSYTARQILELLKKKNAQTLLNQLAFRKKAHKTDRRFQFWQEGSHPKQITSDEMFEQKVDYSHFNPVKRGYVDDPVHWRYSSARNYAGLEGLLEVTLPW